MKKIPLMVISIIIISCGANYLVKFYPQEKEIERLEGYITFIGTRPNPTEPNTVFEIDLKTMSCNKIGETNAIVSNLFYNNNRLDLSKINNAKIDSVALFKSNYINDRIILFKNEKNFIINKNKLVKYKYGNEKYLDVEIIDINEHREESITLRSNNIELNYFFVKNNFISYTVKENGKYKLLVKNLFNNKKIAEIKLNGCFFHNDDFASNIDISNDGLFIIFVDYMNCNGKYFPELYQYYVKNKNIKVLKRGEPFHRFSEPKFINKDWISYTDTVIKPFIYKTELRLFKIENNAEFTLVKVNDRNRIPYAVRR